MSVITNLKYVSCQKVRKTKNKCKKILPNYSKKIVLDLKLNSVPLGKTIKIIKNV